MSDFGEILKHQTFVDKTALIKHIFDGPSVKLIMAPPRFGKSTNLDMMRRFLEIPVDDSGKHFNPKHVKPVTTVNYKLFKENNLTIYVEYREFFNRHFGQYPVIVVNYNSLRDVTDFNDLLNKFRTILKWTFLKHEYILNVGGSDNLWSGALNVNTFKKYAESELCKTLTETEIQDGLKFLSYVLYRYFGRKVFVLIDGYDACLDNLLFKYNPDFDKTFSFIQTVNSELLKSNEYLHGAVLTGVLSMAGEGLTPPGNNIAEYRFLDNHQYSKYYGLTEIDLDVILNRLIKNVTERDLTKTIIEDYYGGYKVIGKHFKMYNIWSVFTFLQRNKRVQSYWCRPENFDSFRLLFAKNESLRIVDRLILGKTIKTDVSRSLSKATILDISCAIYEPTSEESNDLIKVSKDLTTELKLLLYNLGYLSAVGKPSRTGRSREVSVKIPNEEIKYELAKVLIKSYKRTYFTNPDSIDDIQLAVDSLGPDNIGRQTFTSLCESLTVLFNTSTFPLETENDIQAMLYAHLITRPVYCPTKLLRTTDNPYAPPIMDIVTLNLNQVAVFIETKIRHTKSDDLREWCAIEAHKHMLDKKYYERSSGQEGFGNVRGKVMVGICLDLQKRVSVSYSYRYEDGEELGLSSVEVTS